jgi:hypothetical protein
MAAPARYLAFLALVAAALLVASAAPAAAPASEDAPALIHPALKHLVARFRAALGFEPATRPSARGAGFRRTGGGDRKALARVAQPVSAALPSSVRLQSAPSFTHYFTKDLGPFEWAGPYANGQPFACGWSPNSGYMKDDKLILQMTKKQFKDNSATGYGATYDYTAGQIITPKYYGGGCFSVCMKPPAISGVSTNLYTLQIPMIRRRILATPCHSTWKLTLSLLAKTQK